ncbi:MAG: EamA family transporter [Tissierellales bacterium]|jgi:RarD protein|nr:EamA family transporter [Tissierellales bacterium]
MKEKFAIVFSMVLWGSLGLFVKNIKLPAIEIAFVRALVATITFILLKFFLKNRIGKVRKKDIIILIFSGIALGINWILLFEAFKYTSITNAILSYYMAPIVAVILGIVFLREKISGKEVVSILIAISGLVLILLQNDSSHTGSGSIVGIIYGLTAAVFYAIVMVLNKQIEDLDSINKTLLQMGIACLILLPLVYGRQMLVVSDTKDFIFILLIGIVHTAIPYALYFGNIPKVKIQTVGVMSYLDPVTALVLGIIVLGEPFTVFHAVGIGFIIFATIIQNREREKLAN